jgi:hypothetical protein
MFHNHDAGHSHGPTPYFVTDCPLCDAAKTARNQAIAHLAETLYLLSGLRKPDQRATVRLNLAPIGLTGDDMQQCHSIDLSAKQAEALADAIDSMNAHASSEQAVDEGLRGIAAAIERAVPIDEDRMAQSTARFMGWLQGQSGEAIESGEWSAGAVAQHNPGTRAEITNTFDEIDLTKLHKEVCQDRQVEEKAVTQALDDWFGDIEDPKLVELYGDEDDAA